MRVMRRRRPRKRKSSLVQRIEFGLIRLILLPIRTASLPRVRRWGEALGSLAFRLARARTRLAIRNVRAAFPEMPAEEARAIVRDCWRHFLGESLVYIRTLDQPFDEIASRIDVPGMDIVNRLVERGRGLIIYSPHFGSWEAAASVLPRVGLPMMIVARPLDNALLQEELYRGRRRAGFEIVPRRSAARSMMRMLEKRGAVVLLPDQAVRPKEGLLVPFIGRPAWTTPSPARLALRFGAPIIGAFCIPVDHGVRVELSDPIIPDELAEEQRTVEWITRRINDDISDRVRRFPRLWLWMHDRWKGAEAHPTPSR